MHRTYGSTEGYSMKNARHALIEAALADMNDAPATTPEVVMEDDSQLPNFPESAWRPAFADYRDAMAGTTEASNVAHFAAFWSACASTLARSVCTYAGEVIYPNVYLCYFGCTGDKKTTAQRRPINLQLIPSSVKIIQASGSTEGVADALKREDDGPAVALFAFEEFTSLLARGRWEGATILEFFTEAFDCPETWELKYRHNKVSINLPTLSIIAGTTTEWFWKNARPDDFHGGFGNRFLYLTGTKKAPIPNPLEPGGAELQKVREAIRELAVIRPTAVRFSQGAERLWSRFYMDWERTERSGLYGASVKRIHVYVRKLGMVYAALEGTLPEITVEQLKAAIAVGLYASECARVLVDVQHAAVGRAVGEMERKFLDWLRRHDGAKKRYMQQTLSKVCGSCELFNRTMTNLLRADHIDVQDGKVYLKR
ncbi:MAG: hypothetical protein ABI972_26790 [Acidobacteriota bacterium]